MPSLKRIYRDFNEEEVYLVQDLSVYSGESTYIMKFKSKHLFGENIFLEAFATAPMHFPINHSTIRVYRMPFKIDEELNLKLTEEACYRY